MDRQSPLTAALNRKSAAARSRPAVKVLAGLSLAAWLGVAHTLGAQTETRWVLAATTAALASTVGAIAATVLSILTCRLDENGQRTVEATREQIENAREQADRIVEATHQHADRVEVSTKDHSRAMREQIFNMDWLMRARREGEIRAERDAHRDLNGFKPSDSGPFPIFRNGG